MLWGLHYGLDVAFSTPWPAVGTAVVVMATAAAWWGWRDAWRGRRLARRARRRLDRGDWAGALADLERARAGRRAPADSEEGWRALEADIRRQAMDRLLAAGDYEHALHHAVAGHRLWNQDEALVRRRVLDAMVAEVRRLVSVDRVAAQKLLDRLFALQTPCPEASFWRALCRLDDDDWAEAEANLRTAYQESPFVDPPLYLGALLYRKGLAAEAVRYLAEAHRLVPDCPLVHWQLGLALHATEGDAALIVRALERALAPDGLPRWQRHPDRLWADAFPDASRSYLARLAAEHPFQCPLFGRDVAGMVRQGKVALAQTYARLGRHQQAAREFEEVLNEAPPTEAVLRGLGLALARLGRYDEAYKHLRAAHEMQPTPDPWTAGYLALCGALGQPSRPEDKKPNVAWAIQLLRRFELVGHPEWAELNSRVYTEARRIGLTLDLADQRRLADLLLSVDATDPLAAEAYLQLALMDFSSLRREHAWLWCRAAQAHGCRGDCELGVFARAFEDPEAGRRFYAERGWDWEEVEYTFLERWAATQAESKVAVLAGFPPLLGPEYPARGVQLLVGRSQRLEKAGDAAGALASARVLLRLAPTQVAAHRRLAHLYYRRQELDRAADHLREWHRLSPDDPAPLVRLAIVEHQRGHRDGERAALAEALGRGSDAERARTAYLGARLAWEDGRRDEAIALLESCLAADRQHVAARTFLLAVWTLAGDRERLAGQVSDLSDLATADAAFHYLAGVCHLAAGQPDRALAASGRVAGDATWAAEAAYLAGMAHVRRGDLSAAAAALRPVAEDPAARSCGHARMVLGWIALRQHDYTTAARWWSALTEAQRHRWQLDAAYPAVLFLAGAQAYRAGQFEQAVHWLGEALRHGCRDDRLSSLRRSALIQAALRRLAPPQMPPAEEQTSDAEQAAEVVFLGHPPVAGDESESARLAVTFLEEAAETDGSDPLLPTLLAEALARSGDRRKARQVLRRVTSPRVENWLQLGVWSLRDQQLRQAEQEFAQAVASDAANYAAHHNLALTRLSLGRWAEAVEPVARAAALAPDEASQRRWRRLEALLTGRDGPGHDSGVALEPPPGWRLLRSMPPEEEREVLDQLRQVGQVGTLARLVPALAAARPESAIAREAAYEAVLLHAKHLFDSGEWLAAEQRLMPLVQQEAPSKELWTAAANLLGAASCLAWNFAGGAHAFAAALQHAADDPALHQNLALALEGLGQWDRAERHWHQFVDLLTAGAPFAAARDGDVSGLTAAVYRRLATRLSNHRRWVQAAACLERACQLLPTQAELWETLFGLYHRLGRLPEARRVLRRLQQLRPNDALLRLYALDLVEIADLGTAARYLADVTRVVQEHPNDARLGERAAVMAAGLASFFREWDGRWAAQLGRLARQVQDVEGYQVNWGAVAEVARGLRQQFLQLKDMVERALALTGHRETGHALNTLLRDLDRRIEQCRRWEER
ncbi:MAG: tetratricopeptide repeat protein [Gemmataceae bacterium]|nr:tetratricopeptide repeat protein [Gemmataceae bacterium]MDW8266450.1 tetratricopeptide repeat protein [Gemmataceae bacterium]